MTTDTPILNNLSIDLTLLPLEETAAALRPLGPQLATMLLAGERQPALSPLLPLSLVELLVAGAGVTVPLLTSGAPRRRRVRRRGELILSWLKRLPLLSQLFRPARRLPFVRRFAAAGQLPDIQYHDLVEKAAHSQIDSLVWREEINRRLYHALYGRPTKSMPPLLWPLIGELAWNDLALQREIGRRIRDFLRPHYLFYPEFGPAPQFSMRTFWALLALARPAPAGLVVTAEQRRRYVAAHHLHQIAQEQVLVEGWAGFWDQWLLWQARRHWPAAFTLETGIGISLANLPLFVQFSGEPPPAAPDRGEMKPCNLAAADWCDAAPNWLLRQYQEWQFEQGVVPHV
jgi:hypothetical protein